MIPHTPSDWITDVKATCTEEGKKHTECSICKTTLQEGTIDKIAHTESEWIIDKAATCTEDGSRYTKCTVCEATLTTETIPALGHDYSEWTVVKEATCTTDGMEARLCERDNFTEGRTVEKMGHNYVNNICTVCGEYDPNYSDEYTEGLIFTLNDKGTEYSVTGYSQSTPKVIIPAIYKGLRVTSIGDKAFYNCSGLTSITIPNSVTSIGVSAFQYCGLTNIIIGNSVTSIGDDAFAFCSSLTSVTIPDSVTSIGSGAFLKCISLTGVYISDIAAWCNISFSYNSMNNQDVQSNPLCRAGNLYLNGTLVTELVIPDSVTSIGDSAFYECSSLTSVTIPDSVTSIGGDAFAFCISLTSITIGNSVTSIGACAFYECSKLTSVYYMGTEEEWKSITVGTNNTPLTSATFYYYGETQSGTEGLVFTLNSAGTEYSVTGCTQSNPNVVIPSIYKGLRVTSIGDKAFYNCSSLTSVMIPNSVTSIGDYAFEYCSKLTSVTIPDSVTSIGLGVFSICARLQSITIPFVGGSKETASDTYQYPFGYIFGSIWYSTSVITTQYYYDSSTSSTTSTAYCIPASLKSVTVTGGNILYGAFSNCSGLTSVTIGNDVTSIGDGAFYGCESLTSVTIPNSVASIGNYAFYGCESLTSVTIPNSVASIGNYAFYGCESLTSVTIPNSVASIGNYAFSNCSSLTYVTIGSGVTSIGQYAFYNCNSLTVVTFKNTIGWSCFSDCAFIAGNTIPSYYLDNSATAAKYLTSTYCKYYWTVEVADKWIY
jgi:hypothetical protein